MISQESSPKADLPSFLPFDLRIKGFVLPLNLFVFVLIGVFRYCGSLVLKPDVSNLFKIVPFKIFFLKEQFYTCSSDSPHSAVKGVLVFFQRLLLTLTIGNEWETFCFRSSTVCRTDPLRSATAASCHGIPRRNKGVRHQLPPYCIPSACL